MKINKGEILLLTSGEYSDYSVRGIVTALKSFEFNDMVDEYFKEHPDQQDNYCADLYEFLAFLSKKNIIEDLKHREIHLGDYSTLHLEETK